MTYFCPALDPPLDGSGRKTTTLVRDLEYFIHTKFHQNPSSGSGEEVENVNSLTDDRRTPDAGQRVITIGHWSLWLLCPKNATNRHWYAEVYWWRQHLVVLLVISIFALSFYTLSIVTTIHCNVYFEKKKTYCNQQWYHQMSLSSIWWLLHNQCPIDAVFGKMLRSWHFVYFVSKMIAIHVCSYFISV